MKYLIKRSLHWAKKNFVNIITETSNEMKNLKELL